MAKSKVDFVNYQEFKANPDMTIKSISSINKFFIKDYFEDHPEEYTEMQKWAKAHVVDGEIKFSTFRKEFCKRYLYKNIKTNLRGDDFNFWDYMGVSKKQ